MGNKKRYPRETVRETSGDADGNDEPLFPCVRTSCFSESVLLNLLVKNSCLMSKNETRGEDNLFR